MPFAKGVSGNPGGRPREVKELMELARSYGPKAIQTLGCCLDDENPKVRIMAASILLDRGYGKASQQVDMTSEGKPLGPILNISYSTYAPVTDG
jgi:hypothetical protein